MKENSKSHSETPPSDAASKLVTMIRLAKDALDGAREHGDPLRADLAEAAMNDLLERLSHVT